MKNRKQTIGTPASRPLGKNPQRFDPTRTLTLRKQFSGKLRVLFSGLKARILRLVEGEDAFGLKDLPHQPTYNANDFFATCDRDEGGRCTAGGGSGSAIEKLAQHDQKVSAQEKKYERQRTILSKRHEQSEEELKEKHFKEKAPLSTREQQWQALKKEQEQEANQLEERQEVALRRQDRQRANLENEAAAERTIAMDNQVHGKIVHTLERPSTGLFANPEIRAAEDSIQKELSRDGKQGVVTSYNLRAGGSVNFWVGGEKRAVLYQDKGKTYLQRGNKRPQVYNPTTNTFTIAPEFLVNQRWRFETSAQKVQEFQAWLEEQFRDTILSTDAVALWEQYIREGFRKGAGRAFDDVKRPGKARDDLDPKHTEKLDFYRGSREQFLRDAFRQPLSKERLEALVARTFTDLEGVTEGLATRMSRTLADSLVQGKGAAEVARDLVKEVEVTRSRAEVISRTELIRAHSEGQLEALEQLGVEEVGVMVEWRTAGDERVCPLCASLEGVLLKIEEARGLLPRHPQCRCAWIPANVGEEGKGQKSSKRSIDSAVRASVRAERKVRQGRIAEDEEDEGDEEDDWGLEVEIDAERPEAVVNWVREKLASTRNGTLKKRPEGNRLHPALVDFSNYLHGTETWEPLANSNDFFATCDRDDKGRCMPSEGGGGSEGGRVSKATRAAINRASALVDKYQVAFRSTRAPAREKAELAAQAAGFKDYDDYSQQIRDEINSDPEVAKAFNELGERLRNDFFGEDYGSGVYQAMARGETTGVAGIFRELAEAPLPEPMRLTRVDSRLADTLKAGDSFNFDTPAAFTTHGFAGVFEGVKVVVEGATNGTRVSALSQYGKEGEVFSYHPNGYKIDRVGEELGRTTYYVSPRESPAANYQHNGAWEPL